MNSLTTAFNLDAALSMNANALAEILVSVCDLQRTVIALASQGKEQTLLV
jgi:hypothetical protein